MGYASRRSILRNSTRKPAVDVTVKKTTKTAIIYGGIYEGSLSRSGMNHAARMRMAKNDYADLRDGAIVEESPAPKPKQPKSWPIFQAWRKEDRLARLKAESPAQKKKRTANQKRHQKKAYLKAMNAYCRKFGASHWKDSALCGRLEKRLA